MLICLVGIDGCPSDYLQLNYSYKEILPLAIHSEIAKGYTFLFNMSGGKITHKIMGKHIRINIYWEKLSLNIHWFLCQIK